MHRSAKQQVARLLAQFHPDDRVLIPIVVDPDALASALAVKRLLWRKVAQVTVAAVNQVRRPDNLAMMRLLSASVLPLSGIDPAAFHRVVLVDAQPDHHKDLAALSPVAVIDHHPNTDPQAAFVDIRPHYGATATILTEYLKAARIQPAAKLATALYLGIKTDTNNFERQTTIEDLRAFQYVFRRANAALARRIEQAEITTEFLKYYEIALQRRRLRKGRCFVHLGPVRTPDVCVLIADFFMKVATVNWSIVSGVHQHTLVVIFRNDGLRKNAGQVAKQSMGRWGAAGGHKSAARAELPLEALAGEVDTADERRLGLWVVHRVERRASYARNTPQAGAP